MRQVSLQGEKLRGDKGINIPESNLGLLAMTDQDKEDLPFVAANSDVVELSFSNTPGDVELLQQELSSLRSPPPGGCAED